MRFLILLTLASCVAIKSDDFYDLPDEALEWASQKALENEAFVPAEIPSTWWDIFQDPQLEQLLCKALEQNPTIKAAEARIGIALAQKSSQQALSFPMVNYVGDQYHQKLSKTGFFGLVAPFKHFNNYEMALSLNWDIDIWGKNYNAVEARLNEVQATYADHAQANLMIGISVAKVYYELQMNTLRLQLAQDRVDLQNQLEQLNRARASGQLSNAIPVQTALSNLYNEKQRELSLAQQIVTNKNQLNALIADNFMEEIAIHPVELPLVPVPEDLRLNLLTHRPDVTAQLWRIQRISKQIAVAEKSFYPNINFAGFMGYSTILFSKWFKNESIYDQYGPAWDLPLFDAGKRYFDLREQEALYALAVENYNEIITQAVQEVLDALETLQVIVQRLKESQSDEASAQSVLNINTERVKHNLGTQLDVINARINVDNARELTLQLKAMYLDQLLNLIKALGGCHE